jgi:hypothetical protein
MNLYEIYVPIKDKAEASEAVEILKEEGFELDEFLSYDEKTIRLMFGPSDNQFFFTRHKVEGFKRVKLKHFRAVLKANKTNT